MGSVSSVASSFLAVVVACAPLTGCALAITAPNPDRPRNEVPSCDTGKGLVALDGLMATLVGVGSLAAFSDDESGSGIALAGISGLFIASALRGSNAANECRKDFDEYNAMVQAQQQQEMAVRDLPRPVVTRPTPVRKQPVVAPPPAETVQPVEAAPPVVQPPAPAAPEQPEYATPRPPKQQPVPPQPPKAKKPRSDEDDWSSFWEERP